MVVDDGAVGRHLLRRLEANPVLDVERYDDRRGAERAVRRRDLAAAVVLPRAGRGPVALVGPPEVAVPGGVRAAVDGSVAETAAALQLGRTLRPGATDATALAAGQSALDEAGGTGGGTTTATAHGHRGDPAAPAVLGTLVLFVAMNTMAGGSLLAELRELGVVARLATTRASPAQLGAGFGLGLASYALVLALLLLAIGQILFGIAWTSWPATAVVVVLLSLAAGALGLVTGTLLPSAESGTTIAGPAGFVLGLLGGCLWPLDVAGPVLERLGRLTPHAWAVEALRATAADGAGLGEVAGGLALLGAVTAGLLLVGARHLTRSGLWTSRCGEMSRARKRGIRAARRRRDR